MKTTSPNLTKAVNLTIIELLDKWIVYVSSVASCLERQLARDDVELMSQADHYGICLS